MEDDADQDTVALNQSVALNQRMKINEGLRRGLIMESEGRSGARASSSYR